MPYLSFAPGRIVRILVVLAGLVAASSAAAEERILYRSVLPGGQVIYGDAPALRAKSTLAIAVEPHPPDPGQAEAAQRALELTRAQLLRDAAARAARIRQLDTEIAGAYEQLRAAKAARERARDIQEGDRQGRWLLAPYGQRQRSSQVEVERWGRQLDKLVRERRALQT